MESDHGSAKDSFHETILEALQKSVEGNVLAENKNVQLLNSQKVPKILDVIGAKDLIEINTLLNNKKFGKEEKLPLRLNG